MNIEELRSKSVDELRKVARETGDEIWKAKFQLMSGQLKDTASIRRLRRTRAHVETVISEKSNAPTKATSRRVSKKGSK